MNGSQLELRASTPRRIIACGVLGVIAGMFWWSAAQDTDMAGAARALMAGIGALWLWGAFELWRGTARWLVLSEAGLADSTGVEIAPLEQILAVERGMISMKPSHGMVLRLAASRRATVGAGAVVAAGDAGRGRRG